jgi:hypothetical protein
MKAIISFTITKTIEVEVSNKTEITNAIDVACEELCQTYEYNMDDWRPSGYALEE